MHKLIAGFLLGLLTACGFAVAQESDEMPGANVGPRRFGADVGGGRGANGPVLASAWGSKGPPHAARQRELNSLGAASAIIPNRLAERPYTTDNATVRTGFPVLADAMYLSSLKGLEQDIDVESITVYGGYDSGGASNAGLALYEYTTADGITVTLTLIHAAWIARGTTSASAKQTLTLPQPVRLFRDRVYIIGYVSDAANLDLVRVAEAPEAAKAVASITLATGFPASLTQDMDAAVRHTISVEPDLFVFQAFANPVGGYRRIY